MKRLAFLAVASLFLAACQSDRLVDPSNARQLASGEELQSNQDWS